MHQLHCIAPTADLLASLRPKQMGVQCAVTDDAVEIFLHGIIGDEYLVEMEAEAVVGPAAGPQSEHRRGAAE